TASTSGNTVTVTAPATYTKQSGTLTFNAVSPACADPTAKCTTSVQVAFDQIFAIVDSTGGDVYVWPIGATQPSATITAGLVNPTSVAFASNGTLFVANNANNPNSTVTAYASPYTGAPLTTISAGVSNPGSLAVDAQDDLIVLNAGTGKITIYPPPYTTTTPVTLDFAPGFGALALDANQNIWALSWSNSLARFAAPYTAGPPDRLIKASTGAPLNAAHGLALDSIGRLYVANTFNNSVIRFDPPYNSQVPDATIASTPNQPLTQPACVFVGSGDTVFAVSQVGLATYTSTGTPIAHIPSPVCQSAQGMAMDQDGMVWAAGPGLNGAYGIPPPYDGSNKLLLAPTFPGTPRAIAVYP
ncbi:MAG: hypothetical protein JWO85_36, partial [Candidatus Eremiobacteraeota bacterium]|nr:hypothetical protein [Candidatus Eremiobacteraeota bacterium]